MDVRKFKSYLDNTIVNKHQTLLASKNKQEITLLCFFEGAKGDYAFYGRFIQRIYSDIPGLRIKVFVSKNKKSVIEDFQTFRNRARKFHKSFDELMISKKYKMQILFFIDKDFSDLISDIPIRNNYYEGLPFFFITKYYSIENYFINPKLFIAYLNSYRNYKERKLDSPFNLNSKYANNFINSLKNFYSNIIELIAFIILDRNTHKILNLKEISVHNFFDGKLNLNIPKDKIVDKYIQYFIDNTFQKNWDNYSDKIKKVFLPNSQTLTLQELNHLKGNDTYYAQVTPDLKLFITGSSSPLDYNQKLQQEINRIKSDDLETINKYLRGKFAAWFFENFAKNQNLKGLGDSNLSPEKNFTKILSPLLEIPEDLKTMLEINKQNLLGALQ